MSGIIEPSKGADEARKEEHEMKKIKVEYSDLKNLGATENQLKAYNETDPLHIFQNLDGTYTVEDYIEGVQIEDVLGLLDALGTEED